MKVRGVRGATQIDRDEPALMQVAVVELMQEILRANSLEPSDLISVIFTVTSDINSDFPAAYARSMGLGDVPLLCSTEIPVPGSLPRVIRVLVHCETERSQKQIAHIYQRGTAVLRKDLAQ
ncbi:MAG: chorismate mutase [Actinomycetota bacterium]